ncbi:MAG: DUF2029 domain-containing protein [Anaerolinea sp.]|nr:DUF2029 domain-containing protein [Anaerolinea sp.]CAG1013443.1 hypothetical protein ANRL4_04937 [Anaerolineae bacterium]
MTTTAAALPPSKPSWWRVWLPLLPILGVALFLRVGYLTIPGHESDLNYYSERAWSMNRYGWFSVYRLHTTDAPPLYITLLGFIGSIYQWGSSPNITDNPDLVPLLKIVPICADLVIISLAYAYSRRSGRLIIPAALAIFPGLVIVSGLWGQVDSLFTMLVILTLLALRRDKPGWAWALFGLAMLAKFQSIVIAPLVLVLTFRRHGWRSALGGALGAALIVFLGVLPYALSSEFAPAFYPYLNAVDKYPAATMNAFNLWYLVTPHRVFLPWPHDIYWDAQKLIGTITVHQAGLAALGIYTLLIMAAMWRSPHARREFVWAAALYFGFFMLPSQIHERYLYAAAVLLWFAVLQDRRLWLATGATVYTFSHNLNMVLWTFPIGWWLWARDATMAITILNLGLLVEVTRCALFPPIRAQAAAPLHQRLIPLGRALLRINRLVILGCGLVVFIHLVHRILYGIGLV